LYKTFELRFHVKEVDEPFPSKEQYGVPDFFYGCLNCRAVQEAEARAKKVSGV